MLCQLRFQEWKSLIVEQDYIRVLYTRIFIELTTEVARNMELDCWKRVYYESLLHVLEHPCFRIIPRFFCVSMGKSKKNKAAVKARSKQRRIYKKQRYLNKKRENQEQVCEINNVETIESPQERKNTPKKHQAITDTDEFYKEMNDDPLFSRMVQYQKSKRFSAFLHNRMQQKNV